MMWWGHSWGDWLWMGLSMLVFWGGLVTVVVLAVRAFGGRSSPRDEERVKDARAILAERFARGEISEEEFEHRSQVLERRAA